MAGIGDDLKVQTVAELQFVFDSDVFVGVKQIGLAWQL